MLYRSHKQTKEMFALPPTITLWIRYYNEISNSSQENKHISTREQERRTWRNLQKLRKLSEMHSSTKCERASRQKQSDLQSCCKLDPQTSKYSPSEARRERQRDQKLGAQERKTTTKGSQEWKANEETGLARQLGRVGAIWGLQEREA